MNLAAFDTSLEADLVDALRRRAKGVASLVAENDGEILGHIMFSRASLVGEPDASLAALAPMAVIPALQRQGIGSLLVRSGLEECRELGHEAVVVVGHPTYYPRFGFAPASQFGIRCEYDVPPQAFMVFELRPGSLSGKSGTVRYDEAFGSA